jgi:hypothetical protein
MQHRSLPLAGIALIALLALAACQPSTPQSDRTSSDTPSTRSLSFDNGDITLKVSGQPPATITRSGDLLIDGKQVTLSAEQHALLVAYRAQLGAVGMQGLEVGKQGAALGVKAAGDALAGVISGNTEHVGEHIEAQAEKLKQEALKIRPSDSSMFRNETLDGASAEPSSMKYVSVVKCFASISAWIRSRIFCWSAGP